MNDTEEVLNNDIEIIVNELKIYDILAIYLYGGYGRGEGSWLIEKDIVKPYNDYDIAIIVNNYLDLEEVAIIKANLKKQIDIKWIDISQYKISDLESFKPTIENYDFKYASRFLYGENDVRDIIPNFQANEITLKDIEILYFTRLWTLIGSFDKNGLLEMELKKEIFFRNQMAKSILAVVDVVLVLNHSYHFSYKKRVEILKDYCNDLELLELSEWALEEKLYPKNITMSTDEIKILFNKVRRLFFKYFYKGLSLFYKKTIRLPHDIEKNLPRISRHFIKIFVSNYLLKGNTYSKRIKLNYIQGYIGYYYPNMSGDLFLKLKEDMKDTFNVEVNSLDDMRIKVSELRMKL